MTSGVKPLVAGNWKMNGRLADLGELDLLAAGLANGLGADVEVMICPPATLVHSAVSRVASKGIRIGGQDCHVAAKGAHTGDIAAEMLADCGAVAVIVGHSERRADHGESNELVRSKAEAAWRAGLTAIICVGETEAERKAGTTLKVVADQLAGSIPDAAQAGATVIAYEPVWAIGTGLTPTPDDVAEVHAFIRKTLKDRFGDTQGGAMRLLYGGSVKPSNAMELLSVADVNGALVGGASLKAADFLGIIAAYG